jgi:glutathionyl-hydroquinone reductase
MLFAQHIYKYVGHIGKHAPASTQHDLLLADAYRAENQRTIASYPQLSNYLRELYQYPKVAETINVAHFVRGYYSIPGINPTGIIPRGPQGYHEALAQPHDRGRFGSPAEH